MRYHEKCKKIKQEMDALDEQLLNLTKALGTKESHIAGIVNINKQRKMLMLEFLYYREVDGF